MSITETLFPSYSTRFIKRTRPVVAAVNALEAEIQTLTDDQLRAKTTFFREQITSGVSLDILLPEAFAVVREAARRTLGQRHHDVQIIGGYALHNGCIAEMRTGEGKTLVGTLPVYLNALTGKGVHVVTVNDYLARRDAVWMGQIYAFLGLSVGVVNTQNTSYVYDQTHKETKSEEEVASFKILYEYLRPATRRDAYACDITYGTNNEFGFDYLRDNLVQMREHLTQRGHAFAVVDEIDSILIDEARTPLIISNEAAESEGFYVQFAEIARLLTVGDDYTVDEKHKSIQLTDLGIAKAEQRLGIDNLYTEKGIKFVHHLETAIRAQALFLRDKDYVVAKDEVVIVDAFTGRLQPGRRWSEGLHQAIEAKEGVKIQKESRTVASITFQNYFRFYDKLAGMTGTAETSKEEFFKVYGLEVITIPTHQKINRIDHNDLIYQTEKGKFRALAKKVKELQQKGQPVLIGTVSIEKNELLSAYLSSEGVQHTVLNAKNHEREGEIIAQAGRKGSVVVATNMAGRGIDIALGGKPCTPEEADEVRSLGGLYVIGTERHEARRIDNQLRGRAGRQGDPGATQFYVSLEDDLMRVFGSDRVKSMLGKLGMPEDQPIETSIITRGLENAQSRIEGFHFDSRKQTLEYDDVMNKQRETIYSRRRTMVASDTVSLEKYLTEFIGGDTELEALIAERTKLVGHEAFLEAFRRIVLYVNDILWVEHLETMDYTRSSVNLRAYGQREPLLEYKKEGIRLFREMEAAFRAQVCELIKTMNTEAIQPPTGNTDAGMQLEASHEEIGAFGIEKTAEMSNVPAVEEHKMGRNDVCYCGSGKKFKKCHGA